MRADELLIIDGQQKFEAESVRKPSGHIIVAGQEVCDTLKCCHCGHVWIPIKGSGRIRGWCMKCSGPTCGSHECNACYPFEKKLNDYEKGKLKTLK
jgi:hypothetical protein